MHLIIKYGVFRPKHKGQGWYVFFFDIINIIDKIITAFAILFLIKLLSFIKSDIAKSVIIMGVATLVSGVAFLTSALLIVGLPAPFAVLFTTVVLPALVSNVVIGTFVCKAILVATKNKITAV